MKHVMIFFVLFININIFSQGWEILYGGDNVYGAYYKDISFRDDQTGWVLSQFYVIKTTNAGQSWVRYNIAHSYNNLKCFYFLNSVTGWVVEDKNVNYTTNGGNNWQVIDTTITGAKSVYFINNSTGWITGTSGSILKTVNGGYNWFSQNSGTSDNLNAVSFANSNVGACGGDWGTILWTTNGGNNWQRFNDINLGFFQTVTFIDQQTGFAAGTGGQIFRTTNSGVNWFPIFINSFSGFNSIRFTSANTGFAFGIQGEVYKTTNAGANWFLFPGSGLNTLVYAASVTPSSHICVAADSGNVLRSADLGNNWNVILKHYITYENLNSVYFINNNKGFTCGDKGVLLKTENGGLNWSRIMLNTVFNFKCLEFVNSATGYLCGGNTNTTGIIFKTTDSGENWQNIYQDSAHLNAINFINANTGWATGALGIILKTTNGGINWIKYRHQFTSANTDISFIDENTGFLSKSSVYKSTNGGANWFTAAGFGTASLQFIGTTGFFSHSSGNNQLISRTTNSGLNWDIYLVGPGSSGPLFFKNTETGWISSYGLIRKSTNGGINWVQQNSQNATIGVLSIYFSDLNYGWAVGSYGGIMRTVNGGIGITPISGEVPVQYNLFQNYPNPFNPSTKIKFNIPLSRGVSAGRGVLLKIYDVLGKEITVLVNEELKPGTYEVVWDASKYSSGVYFYSLITAEFTQTRKMVVLK